tara:strand:- start:29 stop:592 length:564 start_codon:yes stop_codon:yes gene_type:complete
MKINEFKDKLDNMLGDKHINISDDYIEFNLEFGGFYHSTHSDRIDNDIELFGYDWESIDYQATHNDYAENYLNNINNELDLNLRFIGIDSPREYNFTTDKIICEISEYEFTKLKKTYLNNNNFVDFVNENSKSCDGFISFYSGIDKVVEEDSVLLQYMFRYILNEENEHFDNDCTYNFDYVLRTKTK